MSEASKLKDYQALSKELDEVLSSLQQTDVQVESALELYERGLGLVKELEARLQQTENKIEKLKLTILQEKV